MSIELNNPDGISKFQTDSKAVEYSKNQNVVAGVSGLFNWLDTEYKKCKHARQSIEKTWYTNLAFYHGNQWARTYNSSYSDNGYKMDVPKVPPWRVRIVINKIRNFVRTEMASMMGNRPTFTVAPATDTDEDQQKAKAAQQIVESAYYTKEFLKTEQEVVFWTSVTGNGFFKTYWDLSGSYGNKSGIIRIQSISPFNIYVPDYICCDIEYQPYVIHAVTKPREYVVQKYGITQVDTIDVDDLFSRSAIDISANTKIIKEQVLIREFWIKPGICPQLPKGGYVQTIGSTITQVNEGNIYRHGQYPFSHVKHLESGGFYGCSLIEDLIPLQKEYNKTHSQLIENRNMMSRPKLIAPRGSVDVAMITDEPGQVVTYNAGFGPPSPLQMPPIPGYVVEELSIIANDFNEIAGQTDFLQEKANNATSATAIAYIQEQDASRLSLVLHSFENAIEKVGSQYLNLVVQFWDEQRMVQVAGTDKAFTTMLFKNTSIGDNTDVRVEAGSALPYSKAARRSLLMELVKMGVIQPQDMLRVLEMRGVEKVTKAFNVSVQQAERENIKLSKGMFVPANAWDDHKLHVEIHNQYRRSEAFEMLPDQIKELFAQHVRTHEVALNPPPMPMPGMEQQVPQGVTGPEAGQPPNPAEQFAPQGGGMENPGMADLQAAMASIPSDGTEQGAVQ